jgi:hypothetical protein
MPAFSQVQEVCMADQKIAPVSPVTRTVGTVQKKSSQEKKIVPEKPKKMPDKPKKNGEIDTYA